MMLIQIRFHVLFLLFVLIGSACETKTASKNSKNEVKDTTNNSSVNVKDTATYSSISVNGLSLYRGSYFEIQYPSSFTPNPKSPITKYNGNIYVTTDEATFTSPNGDVEFFVFSPPWAGSPKTYLNIMSSEEVVSEKTEKVSKRPGQYGDKVIHRVTIKSKNGNYRRSYLSIEEQVGTESNLHHVFGIKYKSQLSYEKYHGAYLAFKKSLKQFAD
jgi:hypothetical protein